MSFYKYGLNYEIVVGNTAIVKLRKGEELVKVLGEPLVFDWEEGISTEELCRGTKKLGNIIVPPTLINIPGTGKQNVKSIVERLHESNSNVVAFASPNERKGTETIYFYRFDLPEDHRFYQTIRDVSRAVWGVGPLLQ